MPVNTPHPKHQKFAPLWKRCRDTFAGEDAVKAAGIEYLPKLSGQDDDEYEAYKMRANYYAAMRRTVKAMGGAVLFREPKITAPDDVTDLLDYIGSENESFLEILRKILEDVLVVGRVGILADMEQAQPGGEPPVPYLCSYSAENIISWASVRGKRKEKEPRIYRVVLCEKEPVGVSGDPFAVASESIYRVLNLGFPAPQTEEERKMHVEDFLRLIGLKMADITENPNGIYYQEVYRRNATQNVPQGAKEEYVYSHRIIPRKVGGALWNRIPFTFFNASSTLPMPEDPPLLDLANVTLSHYRNAADLEHGRHFTALPTPYAIGFNIKDGQKLKIGSTTAWISDEPNAKCGYLEFTGQGLSSIADGMKAKEEQMAVLGARLLTQPKAGVESAEAITLRQGGEKSALADIADSLRSGSENCLADFAEWLNLQNADEITVEVSKDFVIASLSPAMVQTLLSAVQQGQLSWNSWFFLLQRADLIEASITAEDERGRIGMSAPGAFSPALAAGAAAAGAQPTNGEAGSPANAGLNGAQIAAARLILADVASKTIKPEQGLELLKSTGLPEQAARVVLGMKKAG